MSAKVFEKILNISPPEIPRVAFAWSLKFLYYSGQVIGFTAVTALFVHHFSVASLPILFLLQAVLTPLSMVIFSLFQERFQAKTLIIACAFLALGAIFSATVFMNSALVFFGFIFLALGIFLPQSAIFLSNFLENLFSPEEGERIFPFIESAHTIGGIFGGLVVVSLSFYMASYKFLFLWILFLFLLMCVALFLQPVNYTEHQPHATSRSLTFLQKLQRLPQHFRQIKAIPFLQGLMVIFFLQWVLFQFLEFQFTKIVAVGAGEHLQEGFEETLTHGLGSFHILFHASALFVQFFLSGRLLKYFGVAGSFLFHALFTLFGGILMFLGSGSLPVVLAKNNFEMSGTIQENAYEASYYALHEDMKRTAREYFEGFLSPLATIVATLVLFFIQFFFLEHHAAEVMKVLFLFCAMVLVIFSLHLQHNFSKLAQKKLEEASDRLSLSHAIEILSQRGHRHGFETLIKALHAQPHPDITTKILKALAESNENRAIAEILPFVSSKQRMIVLAALEALEKFSKVQSHKKTSNISLHLMDKAVKKVFLEAHDEVLKQAAARTIVAAGNGQAASFFLKHSGNSRYEKVCLYALSLFRDDAIIPVAKPFLASPKAAVKAEAIRVLWPFPPYRKHLEHLIQSMLSSKSMAEILAAARLVGDLQERSLGDALFPYLQAENEMLRLAAAGSLLQLNFSQALETFALLFFSSDQVVNLCWQDTVAALQTSQQTRIMHEVKKHFMEKCAKHEEQPHLFWQNFAIRLEKMYLQLECYAEADALQKVFCTMKKKIEPLPSIATPGSESV